MDDATAQPLVVVGAGGHGREVLDVVKAAASPDLALLGIVDDRPGPHPLLERRSVPYLGPVTYLADVDAAYLLGVGHPPTRARLDDQLTSWDRPPASVAHPTASVGSAVSLGEGSVLFAGARVSTNVTTGRHVHLNLNSSVSHDVSLGDHTVLAPGAAVAGACQIGARTWIGLGAVVREGISIGDDVIVGAGAVVVSDVPSGVTVAGVPAKPLRSR